MSFARMFKPAPFTSGYIDSTGRLILVRSNSSEARCDVLMCLGTLTDNEDATYSITFPGGS